MTDTTTADVRPEDDTKPCKHCQSNDHTTNGHFEGSGIDPTKGEDDGGTASPMGHFEGSSIPTGTN